MFKRFTKAVVDHVAPGDLTPVNNILDQEHFQPFCLVRKKRRTMFQLSTCYRPTWYRLDDLLLPAADDKSTAPKVLNDLKQFTVKKSISDRVDGSLSLHADPTNVEIKGAASSTTGWALKLEKSYISFQQLDVLKTERKINMNHSFIQQLLKSRQYLYVVYETIETLEETSYEESSEAEGSFMTQFYAKLSAKGSRESKQSITIPKGCTLAFRAILLNIVDGSWDLDYFLEMARVSSISRDSFSRGKSEALISEMQANCQILSELSSDLYAPFLRAIKAVMTDRSVFNELTDKMQTVLDQSDACELNSESPHLKDLLSRLQHSPGHLLQLAEAITYVLDAFDELMEDQLQLLLESLDKKIVSQQLELVSSILKQDPKCHRGHISVDAHLLVFSQENDQELTLAILKMSGMTLQKDGSADYKYDAFPAIAALYVALYVLDLLRKSDC